jgi:hypothetical protein
MFQSVNENYFKSVIFSIVCIIYFSITYFTFSFAEKIAPIDSKIIITLFIGLVISIFYFLFGVIYMCLVNSIRKIKEASGELYY